MSLVDREAYKGNMHYKGRPETIRGLREEFPSGVIRYGGTQRSQTGEIS